MRNSYCKSALFNPYQNLCSAWYVLYQVNKDIVIIIIFINNYSPKWRWIVVDIYQAAKFQYMPLMLNNYSGPKSNFTSLSIT